MGTKYIRKNISEGYFKNPEELKAAAEKRKDSTSIEKLAVTTKGMIPEIAEKKFNNDFSSLVVGPPQSAAIFDSTFNGASCESITYRFAGNTLVCEIKVKLTHQGYGLNSGDARIKIKYPETIQQIESILKEEYGYDAEVKLKIDAGVYLLMKPGVNSLGCERTIDLIATNNTDLTGLCHLLNSIDVSDFPYYDRYVLMCNKSMRLGNKASSTHTDEPLIHKFQWIDINGLPLKRIVDIDRILSTEPADVYYQMKSHYNGYWPKGANPYYTGIIKLKLPYDTVCDLHDIEDNVYESAEFAKKHPMFKNLYLRLTIPGDYMGRYIPKSGCPLDFGEKTRQLEKEIDNLALEICVGNVGYRYPMFNEVEFYNQRNGN